MVELSESLQKIRDAESIIKKSDQNTEDAINDVFVSENAVNLAQTLAAAEESLSNVSQKLIDDSKDNAKKLVIKKKSTKGSVIDTAINNLSDKLFGNLKIELSSKIK